MKKTNLISILISPWFDFFPLVGFIAAWFCHWEENWLSAVAFIIWGASLMFRMASGYYSEEITD